MTHTALRSVSDAIEATRSFLLPPSLGRIAKLALVALFLGTPGTPLPANPQFADPRFWRFSDPTEPANGYLDGATSANGAELAVPESWPPWLLAIVAIATLFVVAYALLGVVMRFVLVEALRTDEVQIRRDCRRHLRGALGVLGFRFVVWALAIPLLALTALSAAGIGAWSVGRAGLAVLGAIATAVLVVTWAIEVLTLQFVVPAMVADDRGVLAGWRRFWPTLREQPIEYALYGVVRIVVGVAVGIAASIAVLVVLALAAVLLGTIAAIVVVLAGGVGSLGGPSIAILGLLLAIFLVLGISATAAVTVPFQCYLWIYALFVLGDTDPELDLIPDLRASVRNDAPAIA